MNLQMEVYSQVAHEMIETGGIGHINVSLTMSDPDTTVAKNIKKWYENGRYIVRTRNIQRSMDHN